MRKVLSKKYMKILMIVLMIVLMVSVVSVGMAEEYRVPDFSDRGYLLPINFDPGTAISQANFTSSVSYEDGTIRASIEGGRYKDACDYWVADIVITDASQLRTASAGNFRSKSHKNGVTLSERVNAVVALNGDYFGSAEKRDISYTIRQGELIKDNLDTDGHWNPMLMDVLLIDEDGDFHIAHRPQKGSIDGTINGKRILNSFSFGPGLVIDGQIVEDFEGSDTWINMAADQPRQRMAICQSGPLHYKVICCEAPIGKNSGMTIREFAELVYECGVQNAYNLDGGDSTMLYFHGQKVNFKENKSNRNLQDIIYFASGEGV